MEVSIAELLARMGALEQRAAQSWTSHQVNLLDEMNGVAGHALEFQKRLLLSDANAEQVKDIFKNTSKTFNTICQKSSMKLKVGKFRVEKEVEKCET